MMIPEEVSRTIDAADNVVLSTHVHPDGDALGSLIGFADILETLGKGVFCYLEEPVTRLYNFLPGLDRVQTSLSNLAEFLQNNENIAAISLDSGDSDRLGKNKDILLQIKPFVVIDHHRSHKNYGDYRWVNPDSSSTGEMVYQLAEHFDATISFECATNLYVAISTDTGSFRYESTSAGTLRVAANLVEMGVSPAVISGHVYNNYTFERIKLMELVLGTLTLYDYDRLAFLNVTQEMFALSSAQPEDVEGFIDYARSIHSVKVAVFIKEGKDGMVSVSLRAKGEVDVAEIAQKFGGGGHRNAAGFRFYGKISSEVHQLVLATLSASLLSD